MSFDRSNLSISIRPFVLSACLLVFAFTMLTFVSPNTAHAQRGPSTNAGPTVAATNTTSAPAIQPTARTPVSGTNASGASGQAQPQSGAQTASGGSAASSGSGQQAPPRVVYEGATFYVNNELRTICAATSDVARGGSGHVDIDALFNQVGITRTQIAEIYFTPLGDSVTFTDMSEAMLDSESVHRTGVHKLPSIIAIPSGTFMFSVRIGGGLGNPGFWVYYGNVDIEDGLTSDELTNVYGSRSCKLMELPPADADTDSDDDDDADTDSDEEDCDCDDDDAAPPVAGIMDSPWSGTNPLANGFLTLVSLAGFGLVLRRRRQKREEDVSYYDFAA